MRNQGRLTETELVVLAHIVDGLTDQQIALQTGLSRRTVSTHVSRALRKMGVSSRLQAAMLIVSLNEEEGLAADLDAGPSEERLRIERQMGGDL